MAISSKLLTALVLVVSLVGGGVAAADTTPRRATTRRLAYSSDPATAAIDVSRGEWSDASASVVVLARDDVFADSLAGAGLARTDGPVLFTTGGASAALLPAVQAEIERVLPPPSGCEGSSEIDVVGGTAAVSEQAVATLDALGFCVRRFAGATRVETAVQIAEQVVSDGGDVSQVLLARADGWADSAAAAAYVAATGHPILVTPTGSLAADVASFLDDANPSDIVLLGGTAALSADVERAAASYGPTRRVQGTTRDATAVAIADELWPALEPTGVVLVNGFDDDGWVYAMSAAVNGAVEGAVVLFVHPIALTDADKGYAASNEVAFTILAGPVSAVSDNVGFAMQPGREWQHLDPAGAAPLRYRDEVFSDVTTTPDVTYGHAVNRSGDDVTLTMDVYRPSGDTVTSRPTIVWVHGGSFCCGDKTSGEIVDEARTFASKGYVNVSIDYRLEQPGCSASAPTSGCVEAIIEAMEDAQTAVRFLRTNAAAYGVDPARIAIGGSSAGAITALNVAYSSSELPDSAVQAAVSLSGAHILGTIDPGDAPALLLHGSADQVVPYQWAVDTAAQATGEDLVALLTTWDGAGHVPYTDHRTEILDQTTSFLWWMLDLAAAAT